MNLAVRKSWRTAIAGLSSRATACRAYYVKGILARQVNEIWKDNPLVKPNIMLSNSCASKELLQDAREGGDDMKQVYLTHPMRATDYNTAEGFGLYGKLAYLLDQLIQASNEKLQELHNAKEKGSIMVRSARKGECP